MFRKKPDIFFETLIRIADNVLEAATLFSSQLASKTADRSELAKEMKELEKRGDRHTHTIYAELNKTFITPIDREDILALATSMDDVLDGIEACTSRLDMYGLSLDDPYFAKFADILLKSSQEIRKAIDLLSAKKLLPIREHTIRVNDLENEGDELLRQAIIQLFSDEKDPIRLIKRKDVYEMLEDATDACEDAANILDSVIMRNS